MSAGSVISQKDWMVPVLTFLSTTCSNPGKPHVFYSEDDQVGLAAADLAAGYGIVYTVAGGGFTGPPFWAPESQGILVFQVTTVGKRRDHAQWLQDRVRLSFLSRKTEGGFQVPFAPPAGWVVTHREPDGTPPGVIPEGPPTQRIYNVPERYRLHIEPA